MSRSEKTRNFNGFFFLTGSGHPIRARNWPQNVHFFVSPCSTAINPSNPLLAQFHPISTLIVSSLRAGSKMSSWKSLLLRIGDKCPEYNSSDPKEHIVSSSLIPSFARSRARCSPICTSLRGEVETLSVRFFMSFASFNQLHLICGLQIRRRRATGLFGESWITLGVTFFP